MKVTAAIARDVGAPLSVEELELAELRPDEVRVRMVASGICHTDATARKGAYPIALPAVFGHEGAGVVDEVGTAVKGVEAGDHVVLPLRLAESASSAVAARWPTVRTTSSRT